MINLIILICLISMYFIYAISVRYKENSIEYLTLQDFFNVGFWMIVTCVILQWFNK